MAPQLNHTLVQVHDAEATASFLTEVLGLPPAYRYGPFLCVETSNAVSLDVIEFEPDGELLGALGWVSSLPTAPGRVSTAVEPCEFSA